LDQVNVLIFSALQVLCWLCTSEHKHNTLSQKDFDHTDPVIPGFVNLVMKDYFLMKRCGNVARANRALRLKVVSLSGVSRGEVYPWSEMFQRWKE